MHACMHSCTQSPAFFNHAACPHSETMQMGVTCCLDMHVRGRQLFLIEKEKCVFSTSIALCPPHSVTLFIPCLAAVDFLLFFCSLTWCTMSFFCLFFTLRSLPLRSFHLLPTWHKVLSLLFSISLHLLLYFPPLSALMHTGSSADKRQACGHSFIVMLTLWQNISSRNKCIQNLWILFFISPALTVSSC